MALRRSAAQRATATTTGEQINREIREALGRTVVETDDGDRFMGPGSADGGAGRGRPEHQCPGDGLSARGWPVTIGGRRYRFDPSRYFEVTEDRPPEAPIALEDARVQELVRVVLDTNSGVDEGT